MYLRKMTTAPVLSTLFICNLFFVAIAIDCFKCVSINKNYPPCEDPFHNNYTVDILQSPCMTGRKGRDGVFPATSCVKINGVVDQTEEAIIIRGCALDSGTLTTDTELVRMSHCGGFYYDKKYVRGCVQTCDDADACNATFKLKVSLFIVPGLLLLLYGLYKLNL